MNAEKTCDGSILSHLTTSHPIPTKPTCGTDCGWPAALRRWSISLPKAASCSLCLHEVLISCRVASASSRWRWTCSCSTRASSLSTSLWWASAEQSEQSVWAGNDAKRRAQADDDRLRI